jgi:tetratricopeptide (TPR) repeat protein
MRGIVLLVSLVVLSSTVAGAQTAPGTQDASDTQDTSGAQTASDDHAGDHDHAATEAPSEGERAPSGHSHRAPAGKPGEVESNVDYFWRKSDEAFHKGDFERAIGLHKAIVALDPGDVESYSVAAWLMWSVGRGDEAIAHLQRGVKANPNDSDMWNALAENYEMQKRRPEAFDAYKRAVALLPQDAGGTHDTQMLRRRLAHAAEKAGDLQTSVETWRGLVRDFPNEPVNKNNLTRVEKAIQDAKASQAAATLRSTVTIAVPAILTVVAARVLWSRHHAARSDGSHTDGSHAGVGELH